MTHHLQWQSQENCIFSYTQITEAKMLRDLRDVSIIWRAKGWL